MNCNIELHESLIQSGNIICPFCDQTLEDSDEKPQDCIEKYDSCCNSQDIINDNGMLVYRSCAIVQGYEKTREYIDFYENRHKFKRKSVYHRKYYIDKVLTDISVKHKCTFTVNQKNKIMKIFLEIDKITHQINKTRKRLISINFIIKKIMKRMKLSHSYVEITKSKKTLASYEKYWKQMNELIGHKMKEIINK